MNWVHIPVNPSAAAPTAVLAMKADKMAAPRTGDRGLMWQFGVASIVGKLSRGITWNKCSFDERGQGQSVYPSFVVHIIKVKTSKTNNNNNSNKTQRTTTTIFVMYIIDILFA